MKRETTDLEKILQNIYLIKGWYLDYIGKSNQRAHAQLKMAKRFKRTLHESMYAEGQ